MTAALRTLALGAALSLLPAASALAAPTFTPAIKLDNARERTEPRVAVSPDGTRWIVTNDKTTRHEVVFRSTDGGHSWQHTTSEPAQGAKPTIDVDVVTTRTGRVISSELDYAAISFYTAYTDDRGQTWKPTTGGSQTGDTDRQWLAVGPDDPTTHQPTVYLLYHNLASGTAQHNMFVTKSVDGGASFGAPVPIAQPGTQAYLDLQCSDSGGPSSLSVNPRTGRLYAVWGTRTAPLGGGCGASIFGPFEVNVVGATRAWVATSPDDSLGSWKSTLAVDDSQSNQIVGMQLSPGALDNQGNLYVTYTESQNAYPDYDGAALKYVWAAGDLASFSSPRTVVPAGGAGNVLPHVVAGDPGKLDFAWYAGDERPGGLRPVWHTDFAQTTNGLSAAPAFARQRLSQTPTYTGTASELMGACGEGPEAGVENGLVCTRSTDVWGLALDARCRATVTWPTKDNSNENADPAFHVAGDDPGTFVATQTRGTAVCARPSVAGPGLPPGG